jgi:hypothetical protein
LIAEIGLPKGGTTRNMVVVIPPDDEGVVEQAGVFQHPGDGIHLAGDNTFIFHIPAEDDQIRIERVNLIDGLREIGRFDMRIGDRSKSK